MRKLQTQGVHHITINCADRQTAIDFWEGVLGMPFVFEQPNLDNEGESDLYFDPGDGRLITVYTDESREPRPNSAAREPGVVHHLAFSLSQATFWQAVERLDERGIRHSGVKDRGFMDIDLLRRPARAAHRAGVLPLRVVSTSLSIVREKERGTWEQVRMAPIWTVSYVIGKTIPYFVISLASAFLIIGAAMVLFGLPVRGSWLLLVCLVALYVTSALGTGLLVSTLVDSQALAFLIGLLLSLLPTFVLSGFIFPIASMPVPIQYITVIVPARYFLVALRGIVLKGVGFRVLAPQFAALGAYAFLTLALASIRLAKERG